MLMAELPIDENESRNKERCYNGVCMEIAGIESCGMGYSAPEIPPQHYEDEQD